MDYAELKERKLQSLGRELALLLQLNEVLAASSLISVGALTASCAHLLLYGDSGLGPLLASAFLYVMLAGCAGVLAHRRAQVVRDIRSLRNGTIGSLKG